jgi:tetratricopeptide (TPR) repeat protein
MNFAAAQYLAGEIGRAARKWTGAEKMYSQAIEMVARKRPEDRYRLWQFLSELEDASEDESIPVEERIDRAWARVYKARAGILTKLGRMEEASRDLSEATRLEQADTH